MATARQRFKVISLDVWGHGPDEHEPECERNGEIVCDGYTVNAAYYTGREIEVDAEEHVYNAGTPAEFREFHAEDATIVRALVDGGFLTPACAEPDAVKVDGEDDWMLFLEDAETGMPLVHLERVQS